MESTAQYLISKDNGSLQIAYKEYIALMEKADEARRIAEVKSQVLADLEAYLDGREIAREPEVGTARNVKPEPGQQSAEEHVPSEKVSVEFAPDEPAEAENSPASAKNAAQGRKAAVEVPPIKGDIADHFNVHDESGRLFNVFKQYYTCLNESCGGTVRVTMKDGVCSLWNYDEWEEFAFVDILEGEIRFAVDPRYTNDLAALEFCEVPRLLASRRNLVAIQVGDLNKVMLNVLTKAFSEVGMPLGE